MKSKRRTAVLLVLLVLLGGFMFSSCKGNKKIPCPAYGTPQQQQY